MDAEKIESEFERLIEQRGIHKKLGLESHNIRAYRQYLKNGQPISFELKVKLLQRAGYTINEEGKDFTRQDLQDIIKWYNEQGMTYDPDYAVHKFLMQKGINMPAEHINDPVVAIAKQVNSKSR